MYFQKIIIYTALICLFYSCAEKNNKEVEKASAFEIGATQDTINRKVTQVINGEETQFSYLDFQDLKSNKSYDRFMAGEINLPTGKIVCTDPLYQELALPQSWTVKKGKYQVCLYIGLVDNFKGRVAYAELVIKDEVPKYWRLSLISERLLTDRFEKKINGMYPVENGLSCFADFEAFKNYQQEVKDFYRANKEGNYYKDVLESGFKKNYAIPKSSRGGDWLNYNPVKARGNIIMFGSGQGDGLYQRYVGYNENGEVVKFLTDFIQIKT